MFFFLLFPKRKFRFSFTSFVFGLLSSSLSFQLLLFLTYIYVCQNLFSKKRENKILCFSFHCFSIVRDWFALAQSNENIIHIHKTLTSGFRSHVKYVYVSVLVWLNVCKCMRLSVCMTLWPNNNAMEINSERESVYLCVYWIFHTVFLFFICVCLLCVWTVHKWFRVENTAIRIDSLIRRMCVHSIINIWVTYEWIGSRACVYIRVCVCLLVS